MKTIKYLAIISCLLAAGCAERPAFKVGDYLMPRGATSPDTIVVVVAADDKEYKVFSHFLSEGRLIVAHDYRILQRASVDSEYLLVAKPQIDGAFSPDRFLSAGKEK